MKKRIISAILLASLLLSSAACTSDGSGTKDTTDTEAPPPVLPAGIEAQDYDGTVNILMPDWSLYTKCFDPGDDTSNVLNKALFNREIKVENYLGVDITYEHISSIGDYYDMVVAAASTNDDLYQILLSHCIQDNIDMTTGGYLVNMNNMDIDFDTEWFDQSSNEALEVDGKQFFCVNDYMIPDPNVILFNNELIEKNSMESPYDLVREGKWTLDKMIEMSSVVTADNGDGMWDHNDAYGFASGGTWALISFIHGADVRYIEKNADDEYELIFDNEKTYSLMDKLHTLFNGPDAYIFSGAVFDGKAVDDEIPLESGRTLFQIQCFKNFWSIRGVEVDFGILPFPKFDEAQEDYYSLNWSGLMCVPISLDEDSYEMVGDVIELLAYHSEEEVIPAYIEDTLGTKFARDDTWNEMLDYIFDGMVFDPYLCYFGGNESDNYNIFYTPWLMLVERGNNTFASWMATYSPSAERFIADFNEAVKDIEG